MIVLIIASCASGGTSPVQSNSAGLEGQLVLGSGERSTSEAGEGIAGVELQIVTIDNGRVLGTTMTDANGMFMFRSLPNGMFMLKARVHSADDLSGDALLGFIETYVPIELIDEVMTLVEQELVLVDTDGDGIPDSLKVDVRLQQGIGGSVSVWARTHRPGAGPPEHPGRPDFAQRRDTEDLPDSVRPDLDNLPDSVRPDLNDLPGNRSGDDDADDDELDEE